MPFSNDLHRLKLGKKGMGIEVWHTTTRTKRLSLQVRDSADTKLVWLTLQEARDLATILEFSVAQYEAEGDDEF